MTKTTMSLNEWMKYRDVLKKINEAAADTFRDAVFNIHGKWKGVGLGKIPREELIEYAYALATKYGEASAAAAAEMFEKAAFVQGGIAFEAIPAETASFNEVAKTVNGVLKRSQNVNEMAGAISRLVKRTGCDTSLQNAARYNKKYKKRRNTGAQIAWIPSGDTCPFCLMLASNGWRNQTIGGSEDHAEHIHANCDCTYMVRFNSDFSVGGYDPEKYQEMFDNVEGDTWEEKVNSMRRQQYEQNKDKINAQKRAAYKIRSDNGMVAAEDSLRTKKGGDLGVNWKIVKSKEYTERFNALSDNQIANELAAQRARNALVNRSGKDTEELYAISLTSGKDVSKIVDQNYKLAVKRTDKFDSDIKRAEDMGNKVLLIHNHPHGLPPSIVDINELLNHENTVGITVGHNGSIYYYTKPSREISGFDFAVAKRHFSSYNDNAVRNFKALELLSKKYGFDFREL